MDPIRAEIRVVRFHFAPEGLLMCNGQPACRILAEHGPLLGLLGLLRRTTANPTFERPPNRPGTAAVHQVRRTPAERVLSLGQTRAAEYITLLQSEDCRCTLHGLPGDAVPRPYQTSR